jgi:hypothetical protein
LIRGEFQEVVREAVKKFGAWSTSGYVPGNAALADGVDDRPSSRQSEKDVGSDLGPGHDPQVSYEDGHQVSYGTGGSVRPDFVTQDGSLSSEVKNYNIATNQIASIRQGIVQKSNGLISPNAITFKTQ